MGAGKVYIKSPKLKNLNVSFYCDLIVESSIKLVIFLSMMTIIPWGTYVPKQMSYHVVFAERPHWKSIDRWSR